MSCIHLKSDIVDGCFAADHFHCMLQLSFAAERNLKELLSSDRLRELDPDLRSGGKGNGQRNGHLNNNKSCDLYCLPNFDPSSTIGFSRDLRLEFSLSSRQKVEDKETE